MQGIAGAGEGADVFGGEAFLFGEDFFNLALEVHQVAAAAGNDVDDGLASGIGGSEGILIGVDVDALVGVSEVGPLSIGEVCLGEDGHGGQRGCACGVAEEGTARETVVGNGWIQRHLHRESPLASRRSEIRAAYRINHEARIPNARGRESLSAKVDPCRAENKRETHKELPCNALISRRNPDLLLFCASARDASGPRKGFQAHP